MTTATMPIARHRTAQRRTDLSSPIRHVMDLGFLDGGLSLFDYGCGRGDDLRLLRAMNVTASGWDPVFLPDRERQPADIVNLGFVLNVIEDTEERSETLRSAFMLTRKVLIVSVMLGYAAQRAEFTPYNDGVRTQRNTFQKYFAQDEFRAYVERTLDANAILVAPGICLVFRDPKDEQLFLLARQQVKREWRLLRKEPNTNAIAGMVERHRPHIDAYWSTVLERGRPAAADECPEALPLIKLLGSWRRVHDCVARLFSPDELEAASIGRQEDLLVYFALGHFGRRKPYTELPASLQRDVRFFFGNITKAIAAGTRALYAVADNQRLTEAALFCHEELGIGRLNDLHNLTFHQSILGECLPLIRIYVGCALTLFGEAASVDLIKVHLQSSKVTFLTYDNFAGADHPKLVERVKVDLPRLRVDFFDYVGRFEPQPLEGHPADYCQASSRVLPTS